jgi:hypothetical protein
MAGASAEAAAWRAVESVRLGPPAAPRAYRATIESRAGDEDSPRLRLAGPTGAPLSVVLEGGLVTAKAGLTGSPLRATRRRGAYLYAPDPLNRRPAEQVVIVFGRAYASDPGSIRIIRLPARGAPHVAFADATFLLERIADLDRDGRADLIGRRTGPQSFSRCRWTYAPFSVFRQATRGGFEYSRPLSRAYNRAHYVWAGREPRDDIAVDICRRTGPRLVAKP